MPIMGNEAHWRAKQCVVGKIEKLNECFSSDALTMLVTAFKTTLQFQFL